MATDYSWIKENVKCKWNDPAINDYSEEERAEAANRIFTICEVFDESVLLVDGYSEIEASFNELVQVTDEEILAYGGFMTEQQIEQLADELAVTVMKKVYGNRYESLKEKASNTEFNYKHIMVRADIYTTLRNEFLI